MSFVLWLGLWHFYCNSLSVGLRTITHPGRRGFSPTTSTAATRPKFILQTTKNSDFRQKPDIKQCAWQSEHVCFLFDSLYISSFLECDDVDACCLAPSCFPWSPLVEDKVVWRRWQRCLRRCATARWKCMKKMYEHVQTDPIWSNEVTTHKCKDFRVSILWFYKRETHVTSRSLQRMSTSTSYDLDVTCLAVLSSEARETSKNTRVQKSCWGRSCNISSYSVCVSCPILSRLLRLLPQLVLNCPRGNTNSTQRRLGRLHGEGARTQPSVEELAESREDAEKEWGHGDTVTRREAPP